MEAVRADEEIVSVFIHSLCLNGSYCVTMPMYFMSLYQLLKGK